MEYPVDDVLLPAIAPLGAQLCLPASATNAIRSWLSRARSPITMAPCLKSARNGPTLRLSGCWPGERNDQTGRRFSLITVLALVLSPTKKRQRSYPAPFAPADLSLELFIGTIERELRAASASTTRPPVIDPGNTARAVRQQRPNDRPNGSDSSNALFRNSFQKPWIGQFSRTHGLQVQGLADCTGFPRGCQGICVANFRRVCAAMSSVCSLVMKRATTAGSSASSSASASIAAAV